ncbi:MAG: MFS transporter [Chloroflexi bacterium]|nr:MFS transporter [Chloroflexota bacterium]
MDRSSTRNSLLERGINFFGLSIGLISLVFIVRVVLDTSFRMVYPFIPQISAGLKLSITAFSWLLTVRSLSGLFGSLMGILADKYGRRKIMGLGLVSQCLGTMGIAFSTGWWSVIPMLLVGIAMNTFLPAQQAYISDLAPYERRGRALASVDIAFAFSGMAMMPIVGWILDTWGWRVPFLVLGPLSLISALAIWYKLPATEERSVSAYGGFWNVLKRSNVIVAIIVAMFFFIAVGIFMTFWGIWLSTDYGFDALALGFVATGIGIAELCGAAFSGLFIDQIGKRRGSLIGIALAAVLFLMIPFTQGNLLWIRIVLIVGGILVEYGIISLFPLYGEQAPDARATVFSLVALGNTIGLGFGPPLTVALWNWRGLGAVTSVGAISLVIAFFLVLLFLRDQPSTA